MHTCFAEKCRSRGIWATFIPFPAGAVKDDEKIEYLFACTSHKEDLVVERLKRARQKYGEVELFGAASESTGNKRSI